MYMCIIQTFLKPNEKYDKELNLPVGRFWPPSPEGGNALTMTNFDRWLDLNPPKVYKVNLKLLKE
jgi:hypothetical protein